MSEVIYEVVCCFTIARDGEKVSLKRGSRLKADPENHGFDERQFERALLEGKLRPVARLQSLARGLDD